MQKIQTRDSMLLAQRGSIKKGGIKTRELILFVAMGLFALLMISPVLWMFSASFQNQAEMFKASFNWIPLNATLNSYRNVWVNGNLSGAFLTSLEVTLIYVPIHVLVCTLTGYVFAKFNFRFKNITFLFIIATMLIPQETTFFPVYDIVKNLGWLNTPQGVVLPFFFSGFGIFLMRQYALAIPNELIEAAKIDGCSDSRSFFSIALPLLQPGMTALAILALTFIWNEFAWSRLVLSDPGSQTLPIALYFLSHTAGVSQAIKYPDLLAASVLTAAPVLILFLFFQRRFIESISSVGIKG
ncbi:sugar ABC transporter permease [Dictyobacter alpinus]|uniref:Sugar ABC transporter permease n=1 Tax=Dictyobacter alpinus TaxID=2014873 RepID=A0A402B1G1_9CHLR|nr:carbohydrate ABC transporter permease [Dictyobacter alpinus]GCE25182.1 sugar ABC transporter permease [Dictyobacter alpinus]